MKFSYVRFFLLAAMTMICAQNQAQEFSVTRRLADLNPGGTGSFPSNFTAFAGSLYFSAYTFELGRELWRYDGTQITLVTNINDTSHDVGGGVFAGNDSVPQWPTLFNGALYFSAYDQRRGGELWRYDGSHAVRVADINPDLNDTVKLLPNSSWPQEFTVFNNALYFSADNGGFVASNYELWRYDGAQATQVTNIHRDFGTNHSSYPHKLTVFNNALYFAADDGVNGYELWKHDGAETVLLTNINPGGATSSSFPQHFTAYNGELFFQAFDSVNGYELWKTDGVKATLVTNLNAFGSSFPEFLTVFDNSLFFRATDGIRGFELWKYDGISATLVSDIHPFGDSMARNLKVFREHLYFAADDGVHGWELWKCDGAVPSLVTNLNPDGDSFPEQLTIWNDRLYFTATNSATGWELWHVAGETVTLAADVYPGPLSSYPLYLGGLGSELCFSANDTPFSDWEPWAIKSVPFRITCIEQVNGAVQITWTTVGGATNVVQASESISGPFEDLSDVLVIPGTTETTFSYLDTGAKPGSRFYRIVNR